MMAIQASGISVNKPGPQDTLVNSYYALLNDFFISSQKPAHDLVQPPTATRDGEWQTRWQYGAAAL